MSTVIKFSYKATAVNLIAFRRLPEQQLDRTCAQITNANRDYIHKPDQSEHVFV